MAAHYDPFSPSLRQDPYPTYRTLREEEPVHHIPSARLWVVSRHADCLAVLRDERFSSEQGQDLRQRRDRLPPSMLSTDGATHARLRSAVAPAVDRSAHPRLVSLVDGEVRACLTAASRRARVSGAAVDVVDAVARPLAARVLAGFLGVPQEDLAAFAAWAAAVSQNLDPFATPESGGTAERAMTEMLDRFADHLFDRTRSPRDDAFTVLAAAWQNGVISPEEALSAAALLVVGGFEPLADMLSNGLHALLVAGADVRGVGAGDARVAVEELLRFDAPIQFTARTATSEAEVGGTVVRPGDGIVVLLGSANRDPQRFSDPERLDLARRANPHLAFGAGAHACLGAPLARLVGRTALRQAAALDAPLAPAGGAAHRDAIVPRGLVSLPVACAPGPARPPAAHS